MTIQELVADLPTPSGAMRCYLYHPAHDPIGQGTVGRRFPALILYSEIFQQTAPIKRAAQFYAGHGYLVCVPEIFHELEAPGTVLAYDAAGADRGNLDKVTKTLQSYDDDTQALVDYLLTHQLCSGKVGSIGICIGGHLSFRAAMHPQVSAAACFYATDIHKGSLGAAPGDDSLARIPEIKSELMMIWGRQDPHIPQAGRELIYRKLSEHGVHFTWHEFNAAHAFMRDEGPRYDPELAHLCYSLVLRFFARSLN